MNDGAVGDPASNGITVIFARMTYWWDRRFTTNEKYELCDLLYEVPGAPNSTIPHLLF